MKRRNKLWTCLDCKAAILLTPLNQAPSYSFDGQTATEIPEDDLAKFRKEHQGHQTEILTIDLQSYVSYSPYSEPMAEGYFQAIGEKGGTYIVKRWRNCIDQPRKWAIVFQQKHIKKEIEKIEIQKVAITRLINEEKGDLQIIDNMIDYFLGVLEMHKDKIELDQAVPDDTFPLKSYASFTDQAIAEITLLCKRGFKDGEFNFINDFIQQQKDDILRIVVEQNYWFCPLNA